MAPSKDHDRFCYGHSLLRRGRSYGDLVHLPDVHRLRIRCARVFQRFAHGGVVPYSIAAVGHGTEARGCQRGYFLALGHFARPIRDQDGKVAHTILAQKVAEYTLASDVKTDCV